MGNLERGLFFLKKGALFKLSICAAVLFCSFDFSGTKEVVVVVDDNGVISLNFECDQMSPDSKFIWSKNYEPIDDDSRLTIDTKGGK